MTDRMRLCLAWMNHFDSNLCIKVNHSSQYWLIRYWFRLISRLGDGVFWYTLMAGILLVQGVEGLVPVLHMSLTGLTATLIYKWLKGKTLRPRPYQVHQDVWLSGKPLDHFSFPSGHTLHAVAFCGVALAYYPTLFWLLIPFTVMVGMSRVILGLHYPSDVLAGSVIGAIVSSLSIALMF
jgi:undecaprenyl-diphosphatase